MKQPWLTYLLVAILASACSSQEPAVTAINRPFDDTPTALLASPTHVFAATATSGIVATSMTKTPAVVSTTTVIQPIEKSLCQPRFETSLSALGLRGSDALIGVPADDATATKWALLGPDSVPQIIRLQADSGSLRRDAFVGTSPDHHWFAFYTRDTVTSKFALWIASVDGHSERQVIGNLSVTYVLNWVHNDTLVLSAGTSDNSAPTPALHVDLVTSETTALDPIFPLFDNAWALSPDGWQALSLEGVPPSWALHNYQSHSTQEVTAPITTSLDTYPNNIAVRWTSHGISMIRLNVAQIDIVLDQDITTKPLIDGPVYSIRFSQAVPAGFAGWFSGAVGLVALETATAHTIGSPLSLNVVDTNGWILYKYCVPSELMPDHTIPSPDDSYLAWQVFSAGKSETVVLEIATGRWALLSDFKILAWAELSH